MNLNLTIAVEKYEAVIGNNKFSNPQICF